MGRHGESLPGSVSKARGDTPRTRWGGKQAGLPAPTITRQACKGDGFCQTPSPAVQPYREMTAQGGQSGQPIA